MISQGAKNQWTGLSTDTKPTDNRVSQNDSLYLTDTGQQYIYANGAWVINIGAEAPLPSGYAAQSTSKATVAAYVASKIVKAAPGTLYGFSGYNSSGSTVFIQVHDSATLPADTAIPEFILSVPTLGNFSVDFGTYGYPLTAGIVLVSSSTGPTKTITTATAWFNARYV